MTDNTQYPEQRPPALEPARVQWMVTLDDLDKLGSSDPNMRAWLDLLRSRLLAKQDTDFTNAVQAELRAFYEHGFDGNADRPRSEIVGAERAFHEDHPPENIFKRMMRDIMYGPIFSDPFSQQMQADGHYLSEAEENALDRERKERYTHVEDDGLPSGPINTWDTDEEDE